MPGRGRGTGQAGSLKIMHSYAERSIRVPAARRSCLPERNAAWWPPGSGLVNAGRPARVHDEGAEPRLRPFVTHPPGPVTARSCLPAFMSAGATSAARSGSGLRLPGRDALV